jgi:transposase
VAARASASEMILMTYCGGNPKFALRSVARRYEALSKEIAELDAQLDRLVRQVAPELVSLPGIGTDHAATLLTPWPGTTPRG